MYAAVVAEESEALHPLPACAGAGFEEVHELTHAVEDVGVEDVFESAGVGVCGFGVECEDVGEEGLDGVVSAVESAAQGQAGRGK